jgi:protein-tyrosine phosphatase
MFYPAVSCSLVGSAYLANQPAWFDKTRGSHSLKSILLFSPYFIGSWCFWLYYSRKISAWSEIMPGILLGRRLNEDEARQLFNNGHFAVLDLAPEIAEKKLLHNCDYSHVPILDLVPPSIRQLNEALDFIHSHYPKSRIFIHCSLGLSRGAAVVTAFLIRLGLNTENAISLIRQSRPQVIVSKELIQILKNFEANPYPGSRESKQNTQQLTVSHKVLQVE